MPLQSAKTLPQNGDSVNNLPSPGKPPGQPAEAALSPEGRGRRFLRSRGFRIALSLLLAAVLLTFFLRRVPFAALNRAIGSASPAWLAASLLLALATFALRAARWCWILRPVGRVPFLPAFLATAVGFAANNLPAKAGEVIRPALLARMRRLPFSALLASILFERAFDGASVVFFFVLAVAMGLPGSTAGRGAFEVLRAGAILGAVLFTALIGLALLLLLRREATERFYERFAGRLPERWRPRARAAVASFPEGFASLRDPRLLAAVVGGSLFMWFVINLQIWTVMRAFHIELPLSASFVVTAAAVLGLAVPTPGGVGSYQAAVQYALTRFYGAGVAPASGVAILAWAVSFVPITAIGLAALASKTVREEARPPDPGDGGRETGDGRR